VKINLVFVAIGRRNLRPKKSRPFLRVGIPRRMAPFDSQLRQRLFL